MNNREYGITGIGIVAPNGMGKDAFWDSLESGKDSSAKIENFSTKKFSVNVGCEVKNFDAVNILEPKGLRNLDRSSLFLLVAAKQAIDEARLEISDANTDTIGVCTGTTFSHFSSIVEFDTEVLKDGLSFSNPALFPSTVMNAASSQVSIRFNIQGFNTTISTGYTSSLDALKYSLDALDTDKSERVLVGAVDSLTLALFFGFHKLGYMAGIKGVALSCPFDKRRNGPVLGEAAVVFCLEDIKRSQERKIPIYAKILAVTSYFDGFRLGKIHPQGEGLEKAIRKVFDIARIDTNNIDYISSCANSSSDLDKIEVRVLKKIFGKALEGIPISSIKSMLGETFSPAGALQIASSIGAMSRGIIPPTINYREKDPECEIDCVPNKAQKKEVKRALVTSFGPGGYNSACILERYADDRR